MKGRPVYSILSCLLGNRTANWVIGLVVMAMTLTILNHYMVYNLQHQNGVETEQNGVETVSIETQQSTKLTAPWQPRVWIYHDTERPLNHIITTFSRVGYVKGAPDDWDVLWSHHYPFISLSPTLGANLLPHQRINHFPGSGCFTSKPQLATLPYPYIPKAFKLPLEADKLRAEVRTHEAEDFVVHVSLRTGCVKFLPHSLMGMYTGNEAAAHPEKLWVQKNNLHRGIRVKSIDKVNFDADGKFVQEFISNPVLIGGRKFDIGVYTAITSIDPLRVYIYQEEILLRFCSKDYYPFKPSDPKTYVVDDEYTPSWEIPSLTTLFDDQKLSNKNILNIALQRQGYDPNKMWDQVNHIIPEILQRCHTSMIKYTHKFTSSPRHFFEMVRFDFVIDENLKVWLMEVNLSPNMSSGHTHRNRMMYEQVMFNLLSLVGVARLGGESTQYNGEYESVVVVSDRDIQLPLPQCWDGTCSSCSPKAQCQLCSTCHGVQESLMLKEAFLEHVESRNFKRLIPSLPIPISPDARPNDQLMYRWFAGKCQQDMRWCN